MKILVADKIAAAGVDYLKQQQGFEVIEAYGSPPEKIRELAADASAIVVRSETKVDAAVMEVATQLRAVGRAGVGVDNIDIEEATRRGIVVMNTPGGNTIATAELTMAHLLCTARRIPAADATMRAGRWDRKVFPGTELNGKTLGILGLGRIGSEVARRAKSFAMRVLAYDPYLTENRAKVLEVEKVELDDLLAQADFITVHMPLTDQTRDILDAEAIAKMKDGVRLVNCARGGLINEEALLEAVESGKVATAGMDVFTTEPLPEDSPFRKQDRIHLTPHLGASTKEAQENVGIEIAECLTDVLRGGTIRNAVNAPSVDSQTLKLLKPYLTLGERMGLILQTITPNAISRLRITYWGKIVDLDALPLTRAIQRGYMLGISGDHVNDVNAPHLMKNLGIEVETVKSSTDADYNELIRVEAQVDGDPNPWSLEGTLIDRTGRPRIVSVNGREVEFSPVGTLLIIENEDVPGIVGMVGLALGQGGVNIANMSLSRAAVGGTAFTVLELDSAPNEEVHESIRAHSSIRALYQVDAGE